MPIYLPCSSQHLRRLRVAALAATAAVLIAVSAIHLPQPGVSAFSSAALAHVYKRSGFEVVHPYTFEKLEPGGRDAIVRMTLRNLGKQPERLLGASSRVAEKVDLVVPSLVPKPASGHSARTPLEIKAGQDVELKETSTHLRLVGLKKALVAYDTLPVTLILEKTGGLKIDVLVEEVVESK